MSKLFAAIVLLIYLTFVLSTFLSYIYLFFLLLPLLFYFSSFRTYQFPPSILLIIYSLPFSLYIFSVYPFGPSSVSFLPLFLHSHPLFVLHLRSSSLPFLNIPSALSSQSFVCHHHSFRSLYIPLCSLLILSFIACYAFTSLFCVPLSVIYLLSLSFL